MKSILVALLVVTVCCCASSPDAKAAPVILNEYNAVSPTNHLETANFGDSTKSDTFFGRIQGNGHNWFELVVIDDHLDMRNWTLNWAYLNNATNFGSGVLTLTNDALWSNLRSGTILTFGEHNAATPSLSNPLATDVSFDPVGGDRWMHVRTDATQYVTTSGSITVSGVGSALAAGLFEVNHQGWELTIKNGAAVTQFGPSGEAISGVGINQNEVYKLEFPAPVATLADWQGITPAHASYLDGTSSSFGAPNVWTTNDVPFSQDFSNLQAVPEPATWLAGLVGMALAAPLVRRRLRAQARTK